MSHNSWLWQVSIMVSTQCAICSLALIQVHSSTIIEEVEHHCQGNPTFAIAYFYFDFSNAQKEQSENLIRSLTEQLSSQCSLCPESLAALYSQSLDGQRQPSIEGLMIALKHIIGSFQHVYVIVDALDECQDRAQLLVVIEEINDWQLGTLH